MGFPPDGVLAEIVVARLPNELAGGEVDVPVAVTALLGRERLQDALDDVQHLLFAADVGGRLQVALRHLHPIDVKLLPAASHDIQVRGGGQHRPHRRGLRGPGQRVQADHDVHLKFEERDVYNSSRLTCSRLTSYLCDSV